MKNILLWSLCENHCPVISNMMHSLTYQKSMMQAVSLKNQIYFFLTILLFNKQLQVSDWPLVSTIIQFPMMTTISLNYLVFYFKNYKRNKMFNKRPLSLIKNSLNLPKKACHILPKNQLLVYELLVGRQLKTKILTFFIQLKKNRKNSLYSQNYWNPKPFKSQSLALLFTPCSLMILE